jgi:hypothetical protein
MNFEDECAGCFDFPMGHCGNICYGFLCVDNGCAACHGMTEHMSLAIVIAHV